MRRAAVIAAAAGAVLGVASPAFAQPDPGAVGAAMTAIVAKAQAPGGALAVAAHGLGWDVVYRSNGDPNAVFYGKNGGINGSSTWAEHRPGGIVFAAFYSGGNGTGAHRPGFAALERALDGR